MPCTDEHKHQGLRRRLVKEIEQKGISDKKVLAAIEKIPRHCFVDRRLKLSGETAFMSLAHEDIALPIGEGQTISQPYTVAFQTELLELKKGDKVLEIGTGSGYQTIVLCVLGATVFSVERQKSLYDKAKIFLPEMCNFLKLENKPKIFYGDGYQGLAAFEPFDKILVTAGAPFIPEPLKKQLKTGGILVIPVGENVQVMTTLKKISDNEFETKEHGKFRFVPLLEEKADKNKQP